MNSRAGETRERERGRDVVFLVFLGFVFVQHALLNVHENTSGELEPVRALTPS